MAHATCPPTTIRRPRSPGLPAGWRRSGCSLGRSSSWILPQEPAGWALVFLVPAFWLVATATLVRLVDPAIRFVFGPAVANAGTLTRAAMGFPVVSLVLKFLAIAGGLSIVLELLNFDVTTVLAGLGIGGLAFALAVQDTLKNFFGSVMLIWDRTFRVGDLVRIGAHEGVIESVGPRTTRIRGLDDSLLTIPNADLTTQHVANYGARRFRPYRRSISVAYGTPADDVIRFRDGILELIRRSPEIRPEPVAVGVNDLGGGGLEILLQVCFDVTDERSELAARDRLILEIVRLAERLGISPLARAKPSARCPAVGRGLLTVSLQ